VARSITSVLTQQHELIELIVVDDGSTDRTREKIAQFEDDRLTLVSGPNRGVIRARNAGLRLAEGEVIAFLDADDYWLTQKLARQVDFMAARPRIVALGSFMRYVSSSDRSLGTAGQSIGAREVRLMAQGRLMPFPLSSVVFRTEVVRLVGGFDEALPGQAEDLDLMARIVSIGEIGVVPEVLGAYRIHGNSATVKAGQLQRTATRFVRARLEARAVHEDLTWDEFILAYRPSFRQRYGDLVQLAYRSAGLNAAEHRWAAAIGHGVLALASGPRYTITRLVKQKASI
jgi:glycosyltransferase involved in cell wall biosynthesis